MPTSTCSKSRFGCGLAFFFLFSLSVHAQLEADPDFKTSIDKPAYTSDGPVVVIDEAHQNFHTAGGRYKPFAEMLKNDGYRLVPGTKRFDKESLSGVHVLVIANARGRGSAPAFMELECDAVRDWVRDGGSLLLIADHAPFGTAAENLAMRFGVPMGKGWVVDRGKKQGSVTSQLDFSHENGLLGDHVVLRGRDDTEQIKQIRSFTGQSLGVPEGAVNLMKLSATAREASGQRALNATVELLSQGAQDSDELNAHSTSVAGRAQGLALTFGKGRVVILGEADMLSAQIVKAESGGIKAGMNVPGYDNRQFALNILHWLSGLLT